MAYRAIRSRSSAEELSEIPCPFLLLAPWRLTYCSAFEQQAAYASELLHSSQYEKLSAADHGLTTELVMGVLRWRSCLDEEIGRFSDKAIEKLDLEVLTALRLAAYQLMFLDRMPEARGGA